MHDGSVRASRTAPLRRLRSGSRTYRTSPLETAVSSFAQPLSRTTHFPRRCHCQSLGLARLGHRGANTHLLSLSRRISVEDEVAMGLRAVESLSSVSVISNALRLQRVRL